MKAIVLKLQAVISYFMDGHAPSTVTMASVLSEADQLELQTNMTNLIKDLVEDQEAKVFGSRLVCSSGLGGMRVSCFYHRLFSITMDLSKIGKYRRTNHCKV